MVIVQFATLVYQIGHLPVILQLICQAVTYEVLAWGGLACSESFRKELTDFWSLVDV